MTMDLITYEQPLNELMRVCLRIEHLFAKIVHHLPGHSQWDSREALSGLIEIVNVLDRPDLKAKFTKEIHRHFETLTRLQNTPSVDARKLDFVLGELEQLLTILNATPGKLGQQLRYNDFLSNIRQYIHNPGGACSFDVPAYQLWLNQDLKQRSDDLADWLTELSIPHSISKILLRLSRESAISHDKIAGKGFYQESLDSQNPAQLICIKVAKHYQVFPEVSVGRHRIAIRFLTQNSLERANQTEQDIPFELTCCAI